MKPTSPIPEDSHTRKAARKRLLAGEAVVALALVATLAAHKFVPAALQPATPLAMADGAHHADFAGARPTEDVRQLANWTVFTGDHQDKAFVIVDKKDARVWVFDRAGHLKANSPALLGSAIGDDNAPGIGDKPIAQVLPEERTTPAGRYVAEMGMDTRGEDVVWVDYDAAVSMHRVLTTNPEERRLERLASPGPDDNRISYGCINLPRDFYETALAPTVRGEGAIIYVLPETRPAQQVFGSWDVDHPRTLAQR